MGLEFFHVITSFLLIVNTSLLSASLRGTGCNTNLKKFIILRFSNYIL